MRRQSVLSLLCIVIASILIHTTTANVAFFRLDAQSVFLDSITKSACLTTPSDPTSAPLLTEVYSLPLQNKYYYKFTGTTLSAACLTQLKAKNGGNSAAILQDGFTNLNDDDLCAEKCGSKACLCEKGMACEPITETTTTNAVTCMNNFTCSAESSTCVPIVGVMTKINYQFQKIDDVVLRDQVRRTLRVAISRTGISAHCWPYVVVGNILDDNTFVYDIPLNNQGTEYQLVVLNNIVTKKGCAADEFVFPDVNIPKFTDADGKEFLLDPLQVKVEMLETQEFSFECLNDHNWVECGQTCGVGCPIQALCVDDKDCAYGDCKKVRDQDGNEREDERRCNGGVNVTASIIAITVAVIAALMF